MSQENCTHCGSTKHDNLGCWKRLTCQKCGRKGHPFDHCLFVCRACGDMHEPGKRPMEEFYNLIRWNLVRAERSEICIYTFVEKRKTPKVSKLVGNACKLHEKCTFAVPNLREDEYSRSDYHAPGKWFKQAKSTAKINNEKTTLLFDSGAEVSIVDSTFARKVGCAIDDSHVGIGENAYMTEGRTRIKITLAGAYVYYFDNWVGDLSGQAAILGMDFMVPTGIRLDMADGSRCLPDKVRIQLSGHRQLFSVNSRLIPFDQHHRILVAGSVEIAIRRSASDRQKLWGTRGEQWVPTAVKGLGNTQYLRKTNVSERPVTLQRDTRIGIWMAGDHNLALQATTEQQAVDEVIGTATEPMVDRHQYEPPTRILASRRDRPKAMIVMSARESITAPDIAGEESARFQPKEEGRSDTTEPTGEIKSDREQPRSTELGGKQIEPKEETDYDMDDAVCYHEGGDIFPEDIENNMAVLPEVEATTKEITIDDIQVDDPHATPEERERLRRIIWKRRHLLIGAGNALPPAAFGAICDIVVGTAKSVAQRCRRVAPQFREKLSMLIKGLLSAKIITTSASPWASPIVVIIKANGVDIRLCIYTRW
ncbi:hypothetical protein PHMEG_00014367 [Phytophthora megakarya]|uniref:Peptidase A2 domain-containing protein n=1 Tax=Phytophthora megakarya TaxID=4795 RepID=A0A225W455_9STRA|nr:hypothetical protein PHMEG_00014367 [Phytophthora megakarya]